MRVVIDNDCGLCNKLWSILNPVLWAIKNKKKIFVCSYDKNYKFFPFLFKDENILNPLYKLIPSIGYRISPYLRYFFIKLSLKNSKFKKFLWKGWDTIDTKIPQADLSIIHSLFQPSQNIIAKIDSVFFEKRKNFSLIIGIHMRRGDYKEFLEGKYFYSFEDYHAIMNILKRRFENNVLFFIASNEKIPLNIFSDIPCFVLDQEEMTDLYGLSACDYIVGPPSTFSMWASLYAQIPLAIIDKKNRTNFNFRVINSCLTYEEIEHFNDNGN